MNLVKLCRICGDQASGFNYKGLCCESCKVFFHRNYPKIENLVCRKAGNCPINISTRKGCTKCRMDKCIELGMRRKSTKIKIPSDENLKTTIENFLEMDILKNISTFDEPTEPNLEDQSDNQHFYNINPTWNRKKKFATDLNFYEKEKICEVQKANSCFVDENLVPIVREATCTFDCFNMPDIYVKNTIKFCKSIPGFSRLNSADQFVVLKPFCYDFLTIRFAYLYDPVKNGLSMIVDDACEQAIFINFDMSIILKDQQAIEFNKKVFLSIYREMENDSIVRDLLSALVLFQPRDGLTRPEFIRYHYFLYARLLVRYFEHKYKNIAAAKKKFSSLTKLLNDIVVMKMNERNIALTEFNPHDLSHLLIELYEII